MEKLTVEKFNSMYNKLMEENDGNSITGFVYDSKYMLCGFMLGSGKADMFPEPKQTALTSIIWHACVWPAILYRDTRRP